MRDLEDRMCVDRSLTSVHANAHELDPISISENQKSDRLWSLSDFAASPFSIRMKRLLVLVYLFFVVGMNEAISE